MPDTIPQPHPAPPVDAFFARVKQEVHEKLARKQRDKILTQPMFTIPQAAALTGNDVYAIRDMIVDQEIRAVNPTGMEFLIPRDQVLKIMAGNVDNYVPRRLWPLLPAPAKQASGRPDLQMGRFPCLTARFRLLPTCARLAYFPAAM